MKRIISKVWANVAVAAFCIGFVGYAADRVSVLF